MSRGCPFSNKTIKGSLRGVWIKGALNLPVFGIPVFGIPAFGIPVFGIPDFGFSVSERVPVWGFPIFGILPSESLVSEFPPSELESNSGTPIRHPLDSSQDKPTLATTRSEDSRPLSGALFEVSSLFWAVRQADRHSTLKICQHLELTLASNKLSAVKQRGRERKGPPEIVQIQPRRVQPPILGPLNIMSIWRWSLSPFKVVSKNSPQKVLRVGGSIWWGSE